MKDREAPSRSRLSRVPEKERVGMESYRKGDRC